MFEYQERNLSTFNIYHILKSITSEEESRANIGEIDSIGSGSLQIVVFSTIIESRFLHRSLPIVYEHKFI